MRALRTFGAIISGLAFAAALAVSADLAAAALGMFLPFTAYALIFGISAVALIIFRRRTDRFWFIWFCLLLIAAFILGFVLFNFYSKADYAIEDKGKGQLYGGRNVLLLSPHEDDELLMAGGVLEEYIKYGSHVSLAFLTNGDSLTPGEVRLNEALNTASALGIAKENVYFFGYGDRLASGVHIYNLPEDEIVQSVAGFDKTYGLPEHPAYRQGQAYTKVNMRSDIKSLILQLKPDIIICAEVELHPDHSALSLLLDEAMAEILKESSAYQPIILKSSCYATGFYAEDDFYSLNIQSTKNPSGGENYAGMYAWEDRLRLPVNSSGLSRSIFGCDTFKHLSLNKSQKIHLQAEGAINGDKVFWIRDTSSLCYDAQISVSSGIGKFLNDFKLYDNYDIIGDFTHLSDNTWVPDADDSEKKVTVTLAKPSYIQRICLYDDPSEARVLNALITFDDGSSIETDGLNDTGATEIVVNQDNVSSFTVEILETQGEGAGITEIEAYSEQRDYGFAFVKFTDMDGNFVYDHYTSEKGKEQFKIYAPGIEGDLYISYNGVRTAASFRDGHVITVILGKEESETITIESADGKYSDTIVVSNPGRFMREAGTLFEKLVRQFIKVNMQQSNTYQLLRSAYKLIA